MSDNEQTLCQVCNHDQTYCGCEDNECCECRDKFINIRSVELLSQDDTEGEEWYNERKYEWLENFKLINLWAEDEDAWCSNTNDFLVELRDVAEKEMKKEQPKIFEEIHQSTDIPTELCNIISQMSINDISSQIDNPTYENLFNEILLQQKYLTDYKFVELEKLDLCQFDGNIFLCAKMSI